VQFSSDNEEVNELLSRVVGDIQVSQINFPWDDVPEQPKCNGNLNRVMGEIEHYEGYKTCPVHTVLTHTHTEQEVV